METLVIGSEGFIGHQVYETLATTHQVHGTTRTAGHDGQYLDLSKPETIVSALEAIKPEVIINCAGIVDTSEQAMLNLTFTSNLLEAIVTTKLSPRRVVILGSAGEYGVVAAKDIPVNETVSLKADAGYGLSKLRETTFALEFAAANGLPLTVARIFNAIGVGLQPKFLIPRIIQQLQAIQSGEREAIEVGRLDARRDYIDVRDVAAAIAHIVGGVPRETVYNIGSGESTSNGELVELILNSSKLTTKPEIRQTSEVPEPLLANQADITRIKQEFDWQPLIPLEETIDKVVYAAR